MSDEAQQGATRRARRRLLLRIALVLLVLGSGLGSAVTIHCLRFKRSVEAHVGSELDYHATYVTRSNRIIVAYRRVSSLGFDLLLHGRAWPDGGFYTGVGGEDGLLWLADDPAPD